MKTGIYKIVNILDLKMYIGSSVDIQGRWYEHIRSLNLNQHDNSKLQRAWNKYSADSFKFEILEIINCPDNITDLEFSKLILSREQFYLDTLLFASENDDRFSKLGYNLQRSTTQTNLGRKFSEEFKDKIRKANLGKKYSIETKLKQSEIHKLRFKDKNNHPMYNKHHTDEAKKKISLANIGENNPFYGKTHSEETKKKLSEHPHDWNKGEKCHLAKITTEQALDIKRRLINEEKASDIAKDMNISYYIVSDIKNNKTWRHLDG